MMDAIWNDWTFIMGILLGFTVGVFGVLTLLVIIGESEEKKQEKIQEKIKEIIPGKDLFNVKVPDLLPRDEDNPSIR